MNVRVDQAGQDRAAWKGEALGGSCLGGEWAHVCQVLPLDVHHWLEQFRGSGTIKESIGGDLDARHLGVLLGGLAPRLYPPRAGTDALFFPFLSSTPSVLALDRPCATPYRQR